ncbi:Phosphotransferase [Frankia sp. AiPs1]|uniref:hypothetical protein n=1 Tax=Frankia sp. AiPa1 TaxID=573492 RepID=UPI00202AFC18|nr:hypothetical protein [Frankia sp. AiPa1]MCL9762979.1 hypothetical protein [Frankia sp. AiPa1]
MSPPSGCATCWPAGDISRLTEHAERRIAAATADLWPDDGATFGSTVTAGGAFLRQVRVGGQRLGATVRPAGAALRAVVLGDHGDRATVLAGDGVAADLTVREADQLAALAAYSRLRVASPAAMAKGVLFTSWVTGPSLASRLREHPGDLPVLVTGLLGELGEVHHDPADQLRQVSAPTGVRAHPRIVAQALARATDHLHPAPGQSASAGEVRALVGSLSLRLGRLAGQLDPLLVARAGLAFGSLVPRHVLYPDSSPRPVLVSPDLGSGGDLADSGTLLGHLHLLTLDSPPMVRVELVEGIEAWLAGRLAAQGAAWRGWLNTVLTIWAASVYDTVVTALTLPAALPLDADIGRLASRPLPALAGLNVLTAELRRRGAGAALNATLAALATAAVGHGGGGEVATTTAAR